MFVYPRRNARATLLGLLQLAGCQALTTRYMKEPQLFKFLCRASDGTCVFVAQGDCHHGSTLFKMADVSSTMQKLRVAPPPLE